jgi:hypothetical protein
MNSNKRTAATVYSLGTLFVSGIYVQIPCIKALIIIIIIIIIIDRMVRVEQDSPFVLQPAVLLDRWNDTPEVMCW